MSSTAAMPIVFIPHGGGPMPLLGDANHRELSAFLRELPKQLPRPRAILVISAHWEENVASVTSAAAPGMLYDYYGFPPESYEFQYPAPGEPVLAQQVVSLLSAAGIAARLDPARDYDHGTFVPLMLAYPEATIPVVQLSLLHSLDPADHIALGKALAPLREQGVLLFGSGLSFHNMRAFFSPDPSKTPRSLVFHQWLKAAVTAGGEQAEQLLSYWQHAPEGRFCHPREEHLLPLHVCFGAAGGAPARAIYEGTFFNTWVAAYRWD